MTEPVVLRGTEMPAFSDENIAYLEEEDARIGDSLEEAPQLFAGKYKSVEELERGYKELQKLQTSRQPQEQETEEAEPEAQEEQGEDDSADRQSALLEAYGPAVTQIFQDNDVDFLGMDQFYQENGTLSDEMFGQLESVGFTRAMVDAYLSGTSAKTEEAQALSIAETNKIKKALGGAEEYQRMIDWAAKEGSISKEDAEAFNFAVATSNSGLIRLAAQQLQSQYRAANGYEPKLLGGRSSQGTENKYQSTEQYLEDIANPKYAKDPAFRQKVFAKLAKSPGIMG